MQIKATLRYHFAPIRVIDEDEKGLKQCGHECKIVISLENCLAIPYKVKHTRITTLSPNNSVSRYLTQRDENICPKRDI